MKKLSACSALIGSMFLAGAIGCGGGSGMNFNDGNWSMCMTTDEDGKMISNLPFPTGGLPPGAGATIDGITTICTPIPANE